MSIPNTTHLFKHGGYKSVSSLLKEFGVKPGKGRKVKDILDQGCPTPIFKYQASYFYPINQQDVLRDYLAKKFS